MRVTTAKLKVAEKAIFKIPYLFKIFVNFRNLGSASCPF